MANIIDIDAYRRAKILAASTTPGMTGRTVWQWYSTVLKIREPYASLPKKTSRKTKVI